MGKLKSAHFFNMSTTCCYIGLYVSKLESQHVQDGGDVEERRGREKGEREKGGGVEIS